MKKIIILSIFYIGCGKTTTTTPSAGTFSIDGTVYTPNYTVAGNRVFKSFAVTIQTDMKNQLNYGQIYLEYNVDSNNAYVSQASQGKNGNHLVYSFRFLNSIPKIKELIKTSPNIKVNSNNTLTINDSFEVFKDKYTDTTHLKVHITGLTIPF